MNRAPRLQLVTADTSTPRLSPAAAASEAAALSGSTRSRYVGAWSRFAAWCSEHGHVALPAAPVLVSSYLAHLRTQGLASSTLRVALAAINHEHGEHGEPLPGRDAGVRARLRGDQRLIRQARRVRRKAGLVPGDLRAMLSRIDPSTTKGARDRALLLVGFAAALRRSEIASLLVEDVEVAADGAGMRVFIRDAKTAETDEAQFVDVKAARSPELCPIAALRAWLTLADIHAGPVFRSVRKGGTVAAGALSGRSVARIVQARADQAGLQGDYGGHSLRAGFITAALERDVPSASIQRVSRHATAQMIATYDRRRVVYVDAGL